MQCGQIKPCWRNGWKGVKGTSVVHDHAACQAEAIPDPSPLLVKKGSKILFAGGRLDLGGNAVEGLVILRILGISTILSGF
jgi:hypothetical protein